MYEMDYILNCGYEIKWNYDPRNYERNFCNCVEMPEKFRTSKGFEPVTSRYQCDALTNWAMKPLTLRAGHLWVVMFPWGTWNRENWKSLLFDVVNYDRNRPRFFCIQKWFCWDNISLEFYFPAKHCFVHLGSHSRLGHVKQRVTTF